MTLPRLAVFKFASCDGCQLSLLSLEEDLLLLDERIEIAFFPEASSRMLKGPYDIALVEGSVSVPEHLEKIKEIREQCTALVTIGACATSGGIQALRNGVEGGLAHQVYPHPEYLDSLHDSTPISRHVKVDFELWGCPVDKGQLKKVLADLLADVTPRLPGMPLCMECKRLGYACVMVTKGEACMGPVTRTGCGAICPGMQRGCYGCFGPAELSFPAGRQGPNCQSLADRFDLLLKLKPDEVRRKFQLIHSHAEAFGDQGDS